MKFWLLWGFDALVTLGFLFFFFDGLLDGSVSSFNILLWITILAFLAAIMVGGWILKSTGHPLFAYLLLSILALPSLLCVLFFILILISHPRWN